MADIEIAKAVPESPTVVPIVPEFGPPPPAGPAGPSVVLASIEQKVVEPMAVDAEVNGRTGWKLYAILASLFVSPPISGSSVHGSPDLLVFRCIDIG